MTSPFKLFFLSEKGSINFRFFNGEIFNDVTTDEKKRFNSEKNGGIINGTNLSACEFLPPFNNAWY